MPTIEGQLAHMAPFDFVKLLAIWKTERKKKKKKKLRIVSHPIQNSSASAALKSAWLDA